MQKRFEEAKSKIIGIDRQRMGIGTLSEKTVHAVMKHYCEPNEDYHEVPIDGYVADIYRDGLITEIQTRSFDRMREKLSCFLKSYEVTVVYPIPREKKIIWIDEESGELSAPRKSPGKGSYYTAFKELYKIKSYLEHPGLHFCFVLVDMEEYRLLNGWSKDRKKGSVRFDRIPVSLVEEMRIERVEDYLQLLPISLPEEFTVREFAKEVHIRKDLAGVVLHIFRYLGLIEHIGKRGREYLYRVK